MSIEALLQELTKAVNDCTAAIRSSSARVIGADQKVIDSAPLLNKEKTPTADKKPKPPEDKKPPETAAAVTYAAVAKRFLEVYDKGKGVDVAMAAIAPLKSLKEIAGGEQFEGQLAGIMAKLNGERENTPANNSGDLV